MTISSLPIMVLMLEIIAKLPPNAIAQCKAVCKEWLAFISTSMFLKAHCDYMRASADQKILEADQRSCKVCSLNYKAANYFLATNISIPFNARPENLLFLSSLDGMLCVCLINTWELIVWNPLTTFFKKLSNSNKQGFYKYNRDAIGFCVNSSYDYNIVHVKRRRGTLAIYVYPMRLSSWRTVRFLKKRPYHNETFNWSSGTLCGDGLYFTVAQHWDFGQKIILRFDVNTMEFSELSLPDVHGFGNMGVLADISSELHMLVSPGSIEYGTVSLWKLNNGVWIKLLSYSHRVSIRFPLTTSITYYNLSGSCLVITEWGQVLEVDLRFDHFAYKIPSFRSEFNHGAIYTETIVSPGF
ncbi:putative F-box/kelch-repeat protein At3g17570 [Bidens hawaiensis]|uniref:putative F-box/kelch-repeat protein At3g17570 n=1 Tax=Bidens hawaiensis TaxID=980011 RepID=UPI00404A8B25